MVAALSAADHDRAVLGRQFDRRSRGARSGAARGAGLLALGDRAGAAAAARLAAFAARLAGTAKPLADPAAARRAGHRRVRHHALYRADDDDRAQFDAAAIGARSEAHTSDLQSLMRISYAVFCFIQQNNADTSI